MAHYPVIPERLLQGVKTRKQLAGEYDMSDSTFYRHLKKHNLPLPSGLLKPADYIRVYQVLGSPVLPLPAIKSSHKFHGDTSR